MSFRYPGGLIRETGPTVVGPVGGEGGSAPGVWTLGQQAGYAALGLWPKPVLGKYLWSWGQNSYGQLGLGDVTDRSSPNQVGALVTWLKLACGTYQSLSIKTDGTLWAWGQGANGKLGLGNTTSYSSPKQVGALTTWSSIAGGGEHTMAITTGDALWTWGGNGSGQLGLGNITSYSSPKQVGALTTWFKIVGGYAFTIATKTDGTLWAWGVNNTGQLGQGDITSRSSPVQVGVLTNWSAIAAGYGYTIATKTDGTLWTWGQNGNGQLGLGTSGGASYRSSPVQVGALTTWSKIGSTNDSTYAIKTDGSLWDWGMNGDGQLGLGNVTSYSSPKQVGALTTWSIVNGGGTQFAIAVKTNGTLWSWGRNFAGQLGLGNLTYKSSPNQVGALTTWVNIACGGRNTLATKS